MTGTGDLKGAKHDAYLEDLEKAMKSTIDTLGEIANKYDVYRVSVIADSVNVLRGWLIADRYFVGKEKR